MSNENTTTIQEKQPGQMGAYAPYYDLIMVFLSFGREKKLRQLEIEISQIKPGDRVLEIGCGTGTLTLAAKERVGPSGEMSAIDIAPEMVAKARQKAMRKGADISIKEGSIASIPFPENHFDAVMCSFMIFHMPEDVRRKGLKEIYRVLKPGGHFIAIDTEPVEKLTPELQENGFTGVETGERKFIAIKLSHIRATAE
ncbi:class I SAM-dependent methyltransferase [Methanocella sp. MCL-LM]|uniref:class I SAM-dependent methyltransferase n=1 Tax=Methanocella sp. MCL-LM TaxID=3412035 RepID=UPI003C733CD7